MKYLSPSYRATNGFMGQVCKLCAKVQEAFLKLLRNQTDRS
jgi:hypothetical protein